MYLRKPVMKKYVISFEAIYSMVSRGVYESESFSTALIIDVT